MSTVPELAVQLDSCLSNRPPDPDHVARLVGALTAALDTSEGREDLGDVIFDVMHNLVAAACLSEPCEREVAALLTAAADVCAAREVYTAVAAALSETMFASGSDDPAPLGLQQSLLNAAAAALGRIRRRWARFLDEFLSLAVRWVRWTQGERHLEDLEAADRDAEAFCAALGTAAAGVAARRGEEPEDTEEATGMMCRAALSAAAAVLEHPARLAAAAAGVQSLLLEAKSTLTGKLLRFQAPLMALLDVPERLLKPLVQNIGITNLKELESAATSMAFDPATEEGLGAAVAVCSAVLRNGDAGEMGLGGDEQRTELRRLSAALDALTDAAAQHRSIPLALLPLLAVLQYARGRGVAGAPLEQRAVAAASPLTATLVAVMTLSPIEMVRTCAYEAWNSLLDAMTPEARYETLASMIQAPKSEAAAAVALQRLRLEISPAVLTPPFTRAAAVDLALPVVKGWRGGDVAVGADALAAALSVLRFVFLQLAAAGCDGAAEGFLDIRSLIDSELKPLAGAAVTAAQVHRRGLAQADGDQAQLHMCLACERLVEVAEATIEAAQKIV